MIGQNKALSRGYAEPRELLARRERSRGLANPPRHHEMGRGNLNWRGTLRHQHALVPPAPWLSFERWLCQYRARGLVGLRPEPRVIASC
jgi:hypothetical protein